jgi:hypothetical protein
MLEKLDWQISDVSTLCTRVREEPHPDDCRKRQLLYG